jgi:hypothetical protein
MKSTTMILAGAALVLGGVALARRMSAEDKKKFKEMLRSKVGNKLPGFLQNRLSPGN